MPRPVPEPASPGGQPPVSGQVALYEGLHGRCDGGAPRARHHAGEQEVVPQVLDEKGEEQRTAGDQDPDDQHGPRAETCRKKPPAIIEQNAIMNMLMGKRRRGRRTGPVEFIHQGVQEYAEKKIEAREEPQENESGDDEEPVSGWEETV